MSFKHTITTTALTAALLIGVGTAAFAGDTGGSSDGPPNTGRAGRIATLCEHQDEIVSRLTARESKLAERITHLTELQAKATAKGKTKLAERIAERIVRLQERQERVAERIAGAPAWIAEHCS